MLDKSITPLEERRVNYMGIANQCNPTNIDECEEQYLYYDKAVSKRQRHVLFISAKQGALLSQLKKLHKDNGTPEQYFLNLGTIGLREKWADFKIRLATLLNDFPELRFCSLSLNIVNKYMRQIRKVCESSGDKYK